MCLGCGSGKQIRVRHRPELSTLLSSLPPQAILPRAPPRLSAPAPPVPESSKPKPVSRRRRGSRGRGGGGIGVAADAVSAGGGSGCGSGGGGCGGGVESAGGEGGDGAGAAVGGDVGEEAAGAAVALCVHCGESIGEGEGPELCQDCRADQCHSVRGGYLWTGDYLWTEAAKTPPGLALLLTVSVQGRPVPLGERDSWPYVAKPPPGVALTLGPSLPGRSADVRTHVAHYPPLPPPTPHSPTHSSHTAPTQPPRPTPTPHQGSRTTPSSLQSPHTYRSSARPSPTAQTQTELPYNTNPVLSFRVTVHDNSRLHGLSSDPSTHVANSRPLLELSSLYLQP